MLETEKTDAKRSIINVIRGVLIFLMLWGHSIQSLSNGQFDFFENYVFKFIYSFHMPLFMLISGYLFYSSAQKRELYPLIHSRTRTLFRPLVMIGVFNYLVTKGLGDLVTKKQGYLSILDGKWLAGIESLWFLWSVLAASYVVAIIVKKISSPYLQCVLLAVGMVAMPFFPNAIFNLFMYPYFVIGYYIGKHENTFKEHYNIIGAVSTALFVLMLLFFEKKHYIYTSGIIGSEYPLFDYIGIDLYRWGIGLAGSLSVSYLISKLYLFFGQHYRMPKLLRNLNNIGGDVTDLRFVLLSSERLFADHRFILVW